MMKSDVVTKHLRNRQQSASKARIPREQFPRSILVTSWSTRPTRATSSLRGCRACRACRSTSLFSLVGNWSAAVCCGVVLPVCPCVVSFYKSTGPTRSYLLKILVPSSSDTSDTPDFLETCKRHSRGDVTRKMLLVEFQLN